MNSILPGSLVMADQVRYMVYRVTKEDCSRPDLGWDSFEDNSRKINVIIEQLKALSSFVPKINSLVLMLSTTQNSVPERPCSNINVKENGCEPGSEAGWT